jgi:hypothetical protein
MDRRKFRSAVTACAVVVLVFCGLSGPGADAKPKVTKPKRKARTTTTARPRQVPSTAPSAAAGGGGSRNFSCVGSNSLRVTERQVTGTVNANVLVTNVTVTQTQQLIDNTLVAQPVVVLQSPNPPGEPDPGSDLIVFRLNELPLATATDVDRLLSIYRFNFISPRPAGPTFQSGLYFTTYKGVAGPATNEYRWSLISSLATSGAYSMDCQYV